MTFDVNVAEIQETHFVCEADARVLSLLAIRHTGTSSSGVCLLIKGTLGAKMDLIHVDREGAIDLG